MLFAIATLGRSSYFSTPVFWFSTIHIHTYFFFLIICIVGQYLLR